ncbi:MAG TPA: Fe-S cluster assembly protein SufD [Paracoccaceae bacterium]|nr:Fe-S cluster assembly protein SufD [Paracoccaceae bacterium]
MLTPAQRAAKADLAETLLAAAPASGNDGAWAREARALAARRLREMGAPVRRDEYWKWTDPATLAQVEAPEATVFSDPAETPVFEAAGGLKLVFADGVFRPDLSDPLDGIEGVEVAPLSEAMAADIHWAKDLYGALEGEGHYVPRPLAALNTATATEGFAVRVTGRADRPLHFRYLHEDPRSDAVVHHVVRLEPGAELTVLENGPAAARLNGCMEVDVADTARFHHVRAQGRAHERRAFTAMFARLGRESAYKSFTLTVNGALTRNEQVVDFTGDDAVAHVAGACVGDRDFHHDDTVFVTHGAERCESRQVFKKVLRGEAKGIFQGKILVKAGAQKTDGYQISQGLLLDDTAEFLAKPELEIYADDVACSHGSTCGAVDEDMLFYMRARGVPRAEAQNLLVLAFLAEAVQEIEEEALAEEVRERIAGWIDRRR